MAAKFPKGTTVQQVVHIVTGNVESYAVDQETGEVQYCVAWLDADGVMHSRFFKEDELTHAANP